MRRFFFFYTALFFAQISIAQEKQFTMEDAFINVRSKFSPSSLRQPQWIKNTNDISYVVSKNNQDVLVKRAANGAEEIEVLTLAKFNEALAVYNTKLKVNGFPVIAWISQNSFSFSTPEQLLAYNVSTKSVGLIAERKLPEDAENADVQTDKNLTAFTIQNNLYVSDGKTWKAITADKDINIVNGKSVHREEFGITKGTFWSPSGNLLAFYRMDQTMVSDYPIIDWSVRPASNQNIKYPMAGDKSHEVSLGVYNPLTGSLIYVKTGEPKEQYLTNIAWSPDERHIYIAVLNREQNHMALNVYNAATGDFERTLFEERQDKYVEPQNPVLFVKNQPDQFIWQSQRDGYNHLYLYRTNGQLVKQLTKGNWVVTSINGFDEKGQTLFFTSTVNGGINRDLSAVNIKSGKVSRITGETGTNTAFLNDKGTFVLNHFSSTDVPRRWTIISTSGKVVNTLLDAKNPLAEYQSPEMSIFTLKAQDSTDLYCRLYKPVNFDPQKKYPVVVYQYGGPHAQLITNSWNGGSRDLWFNLMAQKGYVVFTLDTRGSAYRGLAFEQATFRNMGDVEMQDQITGVNYLKSLSYVDSERMGLFGWSYGGFMTTSIMLKHPGLFKVGIAGGPVIDWRYYEIMYTERYMDSPSENPEGYNKTRLTEYVGDLQGRLMLIHGAQDNVVLWQHSINFLKAAVDKGKLVDYMVYPGHEHNVIGKDRVHLYNTITRYFEDHL